MCIFWSFDFDEGKSEAMNRLYWIPPVSLLKNISVTWQRLVLPGLRVELILLMLKYSCRSYVTMKKWIGDGETNVLQLFFAMYLMSSVWRNTIEGNLRKWVMDGEYCDINGKVKVCFRRIGYMFYSLEKSFRLRATLNRFGDYILGAFAKCSSINFVNRSFM